MILFKAMKKFLSRSKIYFFRDIAIGCLLPASLVYLLAVGISEPPTYVQPNTRDLVGTWVFESGTYPIPVKRDSAHRDAG